MSSNKEQEDSLREAAGIGDEERLCAVLDGGVDVNAQHSINGWTALHWAACRGHSRLVSQLLNRNADKTSQSTKGELPLDLASEPQTRIMLGGEANGEMVHKKTDSSFVPNYLLNPPFPYTTPRQQPTQQPTQPGIPTQFTQPQPNTNSFNSHHLMDDSELVIKARVAYSAETDFIEVELPRHSLTFNDLTTTLCDELHVKRELVQKVRKLPNTIVRKDKDVLRFRDLQEVELVLTNRAMSESSRNYGPSVSPKHVDVVY